MEQSSSATAAAGADGEGAPAKSPEIAEPSDAAHCRSRAAAAFSSSSPYAAAIGTRGGSSGGSRKSCGGGRAVVEGIYIAPEAGGKMEEKRQVAVLTQRGISGDRYCHNQGTYSVFRDSSKQPGRREPGRHITLVSAEGVERALIASAIPALETVGDLRRNVVLRGLKPALLQASVGRRIMLGDEVVVFVHRVCVPCMYNELKNERPGLVEAIWDVCGVSCEVIHGGELKAGDLAVLSSEPPDEDKVDGGEHAAGFLLPPSRRTREMVNRASKHKQEQLPKLLRVDPGGVARALESYQSVGLRLFPRPKRFRRADALQDKFFTMVAIFLVLVVVMTLLEHYKRRCNAATLSSLGECILGSRWPATLLSALH